MNTQHFKILFRNARKNGTLTFAKLFGLSISFAVILFSIGFVYYETSYDKDVPDGDRIYRCLMQGELNSEVADFAVTSPEQAKALINEIPGITDAIRLNDGGQATINYNDQKFVGGRLFFADSGFFDFFGIPIVTNMENPMAMKNYLVITKSVADKYFGSTEAALGKSVEMRGENCLITGVFNDVPKNFHLQVQLVQTLQKANPETYGWGSQNFFTYFKTINAGMNIDSLNFKISKMVYTHLDNRIDVVHAKTIDDLKYAPGFFMHYTAEPLSDIHFSNHKFDPSVTANKTYVYGAIFLAILVLIISSINFVNLTIANIATRLKEVGIRKTNGAGYSSIIYQFLLESFIFCLISFSIAIIIYLLSSSLLTKHMGFEISLSHTGFLFIIGFSFVSLMTFILVTSVLPVVFLSQKKTLSLIKEERPVRKTFSGNDVFIVMQFALSALIILGSAIVYKQVNYLVSKNRGYDTENVMMLSLYEMNEQTRQSFIEELKSFSAIKSVATSSVYFGYDFGMGDAYFESRSDEGYFHTSVLPVDDQFCNTFGITVKEGRFFEKERNTDFNTVVLNETAVKRYSGEGSLIDKNVILGNQPYRVIGIVNDFNFRTLHHQIQPLVMTRAANSGIVCLKINNNQIPQVLSFLKEQWKKFNISFPFGYEFHNDVVANQYLKDQQAKNFLLMLAILSIAIACVGLYSISYYTMVRRTKEVGIRKVNGARVSEIIAMLNKDLVQWVVLAFIIAMPTAWFVMNKWLQSFAYKTDINWWLFVLSGFIALGIALLTVSFQSFKAATRNPVESLRYE